LWIKYLDLKRIERQVVQLARLVMFASERDAVVVPEHHRGKIVILPNGVDTTYWQRTTPALGTNTLIFTGAMHYPPNHDAALHLVRDILPIVRRVIPDVKLLIVGHSPSEGLIQASQQLGVTVTGFVEDMRPYLEQATVFAAPLRFGSGIQNKVLEALAMELPVVTTSVVAAGLSLRQGDKPPITVAGSAHKFAEALVSELQSRAVDPAPFATGRRFVERTFVWETNAKRLESAIERIHGAAG
jgi:glycosyltransferase involved in cell wall biosynthesis